MINPSGFIQINSPGGDALTESTTKTLKESNNFRSEFQGLVSKGQFLLVVKITELILQLNKRPFQIILLKFITIKSKIM